MNAWPGQSDVPSSHAYLKKCSNRQSAAKMTQIEKSCKIEYLDHKVKFDLIILMINTFNLVLKLNGSFKSISHQAISNKYNLLS